MLYATSKVTTSEDSNKMPLIFNMKKFETQLSSVVQQPLPYWLPILM
ncbi:hypothetical protein AJ90_14380 [Vibrio parahaemolyticus M0605]|nr:hypothetical protein AJ90_14380 [Vibrio parahaemolyticus M0605]